MEITSGKIKSAQKVVVYGPEGIGKSTFASKFPEAIFSDVEGSTKHMDVHRAPKPSSWSMLLEQAKYFRDHPMMCRTWVIDTADWAERLCIAAICAKAGVDGLEGYGYGKGYTYLEEEFGRLLNLLEEVIEVGINIVFTAHAQMRKFEQPDEVGQYDRWEMKLQKKTAPLLKEWADTVLFVNYKTYVVNVDNQGAKKGRNKAQGNKRVMYTTHHPCWDAKNRYDLPEELPFEFASIAQHIPSKLTPTKQEKAEEKVNPARPVNNEPTHRPVTESSVAHDRDFVETDEATPFDTDTQTETPVGIPKELFDLMRENQVMEEEIQTAVASRGYYPKDTPLKNYDEQFIQGVLVGAWTQVFQMIQQQRNEPF